MVQMKWIFNGYLYYCQRMPLVKSLNLVTRFVCENTIYSNLIYSTICLFHLHFVSIFRFSTAVFVKKTTSVKWRVQQPGE